MRRSVSGEIRYSIHALSQGLRGAPLTGIEEARDFQKAIGADDGLELPPVHSRLSKEIAREAKRGEYQNVKKVEGEDMRLVSSLQHPFAPTMKQAIQRQRERVRGGELSRGQALTRLGKNIGQRMLLPAATNALPHMRQLAWNIGDQDIFAVIPPEAFTVREGKRVSFAGSSTPYQRVAQVSPDLLERLEVNDINNLPEALKEVNIEAVSFDRFHLSRTSQTGKTRLPPFKGWIGSFVEQIPVRQIGASINRADELPPATGTAAGLETVRLGEALLQDRWAGNVGDDLPDLFDTVREIQPGLPLAITVVGRLGHLSVAQVATVFSNIKALTSN